MLDEATKLLLKSGFVNGVILGLVLVVLKKFKLL
jgi:hypothetical protein